LLRFETHKFMKKNKSKSPVPDYTSEFSLPKETYTKKDLKRLAEKYNFSEDEIHMIKKR